MAPIENSLPDNLTLKILSEAERGGYGVIGQCCYDLQSVLATVKAAENLRAPAMILLFPVTVRQFGKAFLRCVLEVAHGASVPISVHLDHAADDQDIDMALTFAEQGVAFDSIMIDCSHAETDEENIALAKPHVQRAIRCGVAVEVELGRLAGGEAGVRVIEKGMLTSPEKAVSFLSALGAHMLAPSIGNIHGRYMSPPNFDQEILRSLQKTVGPSSQSGSYMVLHGTDDLPDELFQECIRNGMRKINMNSWSRDPMCSYWKDHLLQDGLPEVYEEGMKIYQSICERFIRLFGGEGKAF
ncbi:aldolase [Violaceomyces palustris]|uniref:Aldolase n=1 Tax=Violaceomyces palustris TaxID=1673888 RepID=A0ACD0P912_9BASI|nr:aldolase [Violaceomyces palustris]